MKTAVKISIVNVGLFLGCIVALFLVPPTTPTTTFCVVCLSTILIANIVVFVVPRLRTRGGPEPPNHFRSIAIWTLLFLFLILQFMSRYLHFNWLN
jgi:hypothetical protein